MNHEERSSLWAGAGFALLAIVLCCMLALTGEIGFGAAATISAIIATGHTLDAEARRIMRENTWLARGDW